MSNITTSKLLNDLTNLIFDPDFIKLQRQYITTSPLECIDLKENNKIAILEWLLSPDEGHLQGDFFLKMLISAVYAEANNEQLEELPNPLIFKTVSLANITVMRELNITDCSDKKRGIDILLTDTASKTIILIERKDGSQAHTGQLAAYYEWVQTHYPNWNKIFILSDSENKNHGEENHPAYIQLNDSWLVNSLLSLIQKDGLPIHLEYKFRDLHDFVFGEWDEKHDPYFKGFDALHKKLAHKHADLIHQLTETKIKVKSTNIALNNITPNLFFSKIIPYELYSGDEDIQLFACLQSNHKAINSLCEYNEFYLLADKVSQKYSDLSHEIDENAIYFILDKHNYDNNFPYCIWIYRKKEEQQEISYMVGADIDKGDNESLWNIADQFAEIYQFEQHKKPRARKLPTSIIIEEEIQTLSLEKDQKLAHIMKEFYKNVKELK